ncbi:MAG TPA: hypothetical protein VNW51_04055 [Mucilaginibacter sp.]|jgi:hypothetical protein|nr:hypothetical protein [Mucilaginibacter sp.]
MKQAARPEIEIFIGTALAAAEVTFAKATSYSLSVDAAVTTSFMH